MKKFMKEYSKAVLWIFLCVCTFVIACYEVQAFMSIILEAAKPDTVVPSLAFTAGFATIIGSFVKSYAEKNSLNAHGYKMHNDDVVPITPAEPHKDDSDEQPEEME